MKVVQISFEDPIAELLAKEQQVHPGCQHLTEEEFVSTLVVEYLGLLHMQRTTTQERARTVKIRRLVSQGYEP